MPRQSRLESPSRISENAVMLDEERLSLPARASAPRADECQPAPGGRRRLQADDPRQADLCGRQGPEQRARPRLVRGHGARRARPHRRPLDGHDPRHLPGAAEARLLLLARVPDRPAAARRAQQSRTDRDGARGARRARRRSRALCAASSPTPRSATAASGGSPPASWKAWRRLAIPAYGYGIRYDHGLFRQVITDGWQHEIAGGLARRRQSVGVRAPGGRLPGRLRRHGRADVGAGRRAARTSGIRPRRSLAVAYDTPVVGWRGRHVNTLRLWSARAADPLQLDAFNLGDHVGALADQRARRGDLARALSERRDAGRPGAAPAAGVLLRLRLAAGPRAPARRSSTATCARCPTTPRSSSTTPIRRSPSPS